MEFDHYTVAVSNLKKSVSFYSEVLMLNEIENKTVKSNVRWFSIGNSQELHVVEGKSKGIKTNIGLHLAFRVNDLNSFVDHLKKHGISVYNSKGVEGETTLRPDGIRQVYFQDPDEYWIEVNDALD
jgi:lactoylglutathione lyase